MADGKLRCHAAYKKNLSLDPSQPAPISVCQMKRGILDHIKQLETRFLDKLKSLHDTFQSEIQTLKNFYEDDSQTEINVTRRCKSEDQNIRDAVSEARVVSPMDIRIISPGHSDDPYDASTCDDICLSEDSSNKYEDVPVFGYHYEFRRCTGRAYSNPLCEDWPASDLKKSCIKIRSKSDSHAAQKDFEEKSFITEQGRSKHKMKGTSNEHGKQINTIDTNQISEHVSAVNISQPTAYVEANQHIASSKSLNSSQRNIKLNVANLENKADNQLENLSSNLEDGLTYNSYSAVPRQPLLTTHNEYEEVQLPGKDENHVLSLNEFTSSYRSSKRDSKLITPSKGLKENFDANTNRDPTSATNVHSQSATEVKDSVTHVKKALLSSEGFSGNCSSTTYCKRPIPFQHPQSRIGEPSIFSNPQKPPCRSSSVQTRAKYVVDDKPRTHSSYHARYEVEFDERECLANALQYHVTDLVDGLVFADSELPDWLLTEDCVTEDECMTLRKQRNRKDQIRLLIALIKVRDLRVLKTFLGHVERQNEHVANKIKEKFESNTREGMKARLCAYCNLKKQVNVKYVADHLWSVQAIEDNLYFKIINTDRAVGDQNTLWREVTQSFSLQDQRRCKIAHELLLRALDDKKGYSHHIEGLQNMLINNHGRLTCSCEPKFRLAYTDNTRDTTSSESYIPDSNSEAFDDRSTLSIATTCR